MNYTSYGLGIPYLAGALGRVSMHQLKKKPIGITWINIQFLPLIFFHGQPAFYLKAAAVGQSIHYFISISATHTYNGCKGIRGEKEDQRVRMVGAATIVLLLLYVHCILNSALIVPSFPLTKLRKVFN